MASPAIDSSKREAFIIKQLRDQLMLGRTLQEAKLRFLEAFDEAEIDRAIEVFKAGDERFKSASEISTLHDEPNYSSWYGGPDERTTSVWSGLKRTLKSKSWSDLMIGVLFQKVRSLRFFAGDEALVMAMTHVCAIVAGNSATLKLSV